MTPATPALRSDPVMASAAASPTTATGTVPMTIARSTTASPPGPRHARGAAAASANPVTSRRK